MYRHLAAALLAFVAACGPVDPAEPLRVAAADSPVHLRVGEEVMIEGTGLSIRFLAVPEDSRCPINAICVWQGDARVDLRLTDRTSGTVPASLHTGVEPRAVVVGGARIELEMLLPAQESETRIAQERYTATLRVSPLP